MSNAIAAPCSEHTTKKQSFFHEAPTRALLFHFRTARAVAAFLPRRSSFRQAFGGIFNSWRPFDCPSASRPAGCRRSPEGSCRFRPLKLKQAIKMRPNSHEWPYSYECTQLCCAIRACTVSAQPTILVLARVLQQGRRRARGGVHVGGVLTLARRVTRTCKIRWVRRKAVWYS